ncbi:hypothetical protein [Burkholderia cepacia]|uniref:hypothetical protein n=1 Tax=Burkholderia cepacia TaxID=292 RepID=UPI001CF1C74F|nr:hypothetical protein [Burkholderia cepacia]MCA8351440.1 hypothetical protein [Burkholderia cepacia]HDR9189366.1 hypothetical protein [Burkholderia vietnamiensis]
MKDFGGISFEDAKKITQAKLSEVQMKVALLLMSTEYRGVHCGVPATWITDELGLEGNVVSDLEVLVKKGLVKKVKHEVKNGPEFFIFDTSEEQPNVKDFSLMLVSRKNGQALDVVKE